MPANSAEYILREYFGGRLSSGLVGDVRQWVGECGQREDVEAALRKLWDERVGYDRNPSPEVYSSLNDTCAKLGIPGLDIAGGGSPRLQRPREVGRTPGRRIVFRAAAVLIPLLLVAGVLWTVLDRPYMRQPMVAAAQTEGVVAGTEKVQKNFPDGTKVWVNGHSRISYGQGCERHLALTGEACFSVAHNEAEPFTLQTLRFDITVLGTVFDVRDVPGETECSISLYRGKVRAVTAAGEYTLEAGERLVWDTGTGVPRVEKMDETGPGWMSRSICFVHTRVSEVLDSLMERYGIQAGIDGDTDFENGIVTLKLNSNDSFETAMEVLSQICGTFTYRIEGDKVTITGKQID